MPNPTCSWCKGTGHFYSPPIDSDDVGDVEQCDCPHFADVNYGNTPPTATE